MTFLQWGAFAFGAVIGWFTYQVTRYRTDIKLADVLTIIGALGGGAVLTLFPEETDSFAAYGIGLATGYFAYFLVLLILVRTSKGWTMEWFLDGRRPPLEEKVEAVARAGRGMGVVTEAPPRAREAADGAIRTSEFD
ncbi:hypothetical protein ACGFIG_11100 [Micromonospora sp. NPDC049048]|uniref:hypothetical protein n=1 Tax=Micromonospora sp. NPDC049048 TaxID=3364263 RepID=UPI00371CF9B3